MSPLMTAVNEGHHIYRVNDTEIDTSRVCVRRDGQEKHLRQKTFHVLVYLVQNRQRVISKDELVAKVWQGTAVTDNSLEQCLFEIRKLLGDDSRRPRFIKTVPRSGYRFIGEVEELASEQVFAPKKVIAAPESSSLAAIPQRPARWTSRSVWIISSIAMCVAIGLVAFYVIRERSKGRSLVSTTLAQDPRKLPVAVMFFDNESGSADLDWLREGLADMIITNLSGSPNLAVLSRQQLHVLLDRIGQQRSAKITLDEALNVAKQTQAKLMVLGSFSTLGEQIRIDVHLHDARDGQLLTSERLVVNQPAQILTQIDLLSLKLNSYIGGSKESEPRTAGTSLLTNNLEAFRYYSLGLEKAQSLRNEEALELLQKAIAVDQNFAMAYARVGYVYGVTGNSPDKSKRYLEKAFRITDRLTEKDKLNIEAWYAIANYDYAAAIGAFRKIIANYPLEVEAYRRLANLLRGEEKFQEAIEVLKQALVIDPGEKDLYNALGLAYSETAHHDEAIAMLRRYVQLAPEEPNSHDSLGLALQWAGRYDEAILEYKRALELKPDFEIAIVHLGNVYFQQGRYRYAIDEFQKYLKASPSDFERGRGWSAIAYVELRRGNIPAAERATKMAARFGPTATPEMFFVAIAKGDLNTANQIEEQLERSLINERGFRSSGRPLWVRRGFSALKSKSPAEAIDTFKEGLKHRPQTWNTDAFEDCLANGYLELGRFDEAMAEYQRILKLNPNYPLVHYHLGQALERKGRADLARAEYDSFIRSWKEADVDLAEVVAAKKAVESGN